MLLWNIFILSFLFLFFLCRLVGWTNLEGENVRGATATLYGLVDPGYPRGWFSVTTCH
jgi:hypothetical protein